MSQTAPINIKPSSVTQYCESKCDYKFDYKTSNVIITNKSNYIQLSYDQSSSPQVLYNSKNYKVREVRLYAPSIHKIEGARAKGELLIIHSSDDKNLIVSVPIKTSSISSKVSRFLDQVADYVTKFTPNPEDSASMGNATWNLDDFIPEKKFFSYSGTAPYPPYSDGYDYVVFNNIDSIIMTQESLNKITKHISESKIETVSIGDTIVFKSKNPAKFSLNNSSDDIYIDCQLESESKEKEIISGMKLENHASKYKNIFEYIKNVGWLNNPFVIALLISLGLIIILSLGYMVQKKLKERKLSTGGTTTVGSSVSSV